jgi:glucosylceramidase
METMILKRIQKMRLACFLITLLLTGTTFLGCSAKSTETNPSSNEGITVWLSDPAANVLFTKQENPLKFGTKTNEVTTIEIDPSKTFQPIDGFGWCLTGGSARLINQMGKNERAALLKELFSTEGNGIGSSYLRISIAASDLSDSVFSYDDLPAGETDPTMEKFSINIEKAHLIPVLKEIIAINPNIKILGSPWSAPKWMKTNNDTRGGSLKPELRDVYARYFVKYIKSMAIEGIKIDAITVQNEPLHPGNNPSMYMTAEDQALFVKQNLGPAFQKEGIKTKIIVYDHNADRPDYPLTIYKDPDAAKYVDGSAFHLYGGKIETLTDVHNAFPEKNLYFTEQWVGAPGNMAQDLLWHVNTLVIGATRNWCRNVLEWNLAADTKYDPHTDRGGCDKCLGAITIDGNKVTRNPAYYIVAHAAKFVHPGAVRIATNLPEGVSNVAFKNSNGTIVLIVANTSNEEKRFNIKIEGKSATGNLNAGAIGTYVID